MKKLGRVVVIGLGQFGASVARQLAELGGDVLAIDRSEERVQAIADVVSHARVANGSELPVLSELRVDTTSAVLNAIGEQYLLDSILCTAHLKQLGAPRIICRATTEVHARVLRATGADEIVEPEAEIGKVVAKRIARAGLVNQFDLGHDMAAVEIAVPEGWVERTLAQLNLRRKMGIQVAAVRPASKEEWLPPDPDEAFRRGDHVLALGKTKAIDALIRGALA